MNITTETRDSAKKKLNAKLAQYFTASELDTLENHIHQHTIKSHGDRQSQKFYDQTLKKVLLHLNPESYIKNSYPITAVKQGKLQLEQIPYMSSVELHPAAWEKQIHDQSIEARQVVDGKTNIATTTMLTCPNCKSKKAKYEERQMRSADEAADILAECLACGCKFKR